MTESHRDSPWTGYLQKRKKREIKDIRNPKTAVSKGDCPYQRNDSAGRFKAAKRQKSCDASIRQRNILGGGSRWIGLFKARGINARDGGVWSSANLCSPLVTNWTFTTTAVCLRLHFRADLADAFCPKRLTVIRTFISSNVMFSIFPKDTSTCRPGESNQRFQALARPPEPQPPVFLSLTV